jgi:hypothetical protein
MTGGATLRLMSKDTTASAAQIMQFAIEDERTTYPHDGMDIASAAAVGPPSWMETPDPMLLPHPPSAPPRPLALPAPPPPRPFSFDDAQAKRARVDGAIVPYVHQPGPSRANRQQLVRSKMAKPVTSYDPTPGADGRRS